MNAEKYLMRMNECRRDRRRFSGKEDHWFTNGSAAGMEKKKRRREVNLSQGNFRFLKFTLNNKTDESTDVKSREKERREIRKKIRVKSVSSS